MREFKLPDLGEGLTGAEVVRWLVEVGEVIVVDQPVVEVETAKAMVEVPCPYGGVVTARYGEVGEEREVGQPLVMVAVAPSGSSDMPAQPAGPRRTWRTVPPATCWWGTGFRRAARVRAAAGSACPSRRPLRPPVARRRPLSGRDGRRGRRSGRGARGPGCRCPPWSR